MIEPFANELDKITKISILGSIFEGDNIFFCESPLLSTKNTFKVFELKKPFRKSK